MNKAVYSESGPLHSSQTNLLVGICFFLYFFPLPFLGSAHESGPPGELPSIFYFSLLGWGILLGWIFVYRVLRALKGLMGQKKLLQNGRQTVASIVKYQFPETRLGSGIELWLEFNNLCGTRIMAHILVPGSRKDLALYQSGNTVDIMLNETSVWPPLALKNARPDRKRVMMALGWFVFTAVYMVLAHLYLCGALTGTGHVADLEFTTPIVVIPYAYTLLFVIFGRLFGEQSSDIRAMLLLRGKRAQAQVIGSHQTGTYLNHQPEIKFHIRFRNDQAQDIDATVRRIVDLASMYSADMNVFEVVYLPDDPQKVAIVDF